MDILLLVKTIILGIVEGITEWLPISSTGHLILADEFIKLNMSAEFMEMFNVVIQLGAIMAVVVLYFHKLNPFSPSKSRTEKGETMILWSKVILAVLPAAVIGIPGTSRSGATILGGILIGCSRTVAAEFSFFLGIPVMFGASFIKILKFGLNFTSMEAIVLITGMAVSFIVSVIAIKFLLGYIKNNDFKAFGVYRIILGILVIAYFALA